LAVSDWKDRWKKYLLELWMGFSDGAKRWDSHAVSASTGGLFARAVVGRKRGGSPGFALFSALE
jgi:hypothetical protein